MYLELLEQMNRQEYDPETKAVGRAAASLDRAYEDWTRESVERMERAGRGKTEAERAGLDAIEGGVMLVTEVPINAAAPGLGAALEGVKTFGDASQRARQSGGNIGQQVLYGAANAGYEAALESYIDGIIRARGGNIENLFKNEGLKNVAGNLVNAGGEFLGTLAEDMVEPAFDSIYNGKNISENYTSETLPNAIRDAVNQAALGYISAAEERRLKRGYQFAADLTRDMRNEQLKYIEEYERQKRKQTLTMSEQIVLQSRPKGPGTYVSRRGGYVQRR